MSADVKEAGKDRYEVTITLKNILTDEEAKEVSSYVTGYTYGDIIGYLHLFAPKDGEISDVIASDGTKFKYATYHGYNLSYSLGIQLNKGETVKITYTITSSEPFEFVTTPVFTGRR